MLRKLPVAAGPRSPQPRRSEPRLFPANAPPAVARAAAPDLGGVAATETAPDPAPSALSDGERRPLAAETSAGVLRYAIVGGLAALVLAAPVGIAVWRAAPPGSAPAATQSLPPASVNPANPLSAAAKPLGAAASASPGTAAKPGDASSAASPPAAALPPPSGNPPAEPAAASGTPTAVPSTASKSPSPAARESSAADLSSPSGGPVTGSAPPAAPAAAQPLAAPMPQPPAVTPAAAQPPATPPQPAAAAAAAPPPPAPKPSVGNHRRARGEAAAHRSVRTHEMAQHHRAPRPARTASARERRLAPSFTPPQHGQAGEFDRLLNNLTTPDATTAARERPPGQSLSPPAADAPDPFAGRAGD